VIDSKISDHYIS